MCGEGDMVVMCEDDGDVEVWLCVCWVVDGCKNFDVEDVLWCVGIVKVCE